MWWCIIILVYFIIVSAINEFDYPKSRKDAIWSVLWPIKLIVTLSKFVIWLANASIGCLLCCLGFDIRTNKTYTKIDHW